MAESRTQKSMRNLAFGTLNQVVILILSFISRTIFIRILGVEYLGISSLFTDILTMLSMADLGFGTAMAYSFYKLLAEDNHMRIAALLKFYKTVYNVIAFCVAVIGLLLLPFLQYIVNLDNAIQNIRLYYLLFVANTVISYLFVVKALIINADQKNYMISKYHILVNCGRMIFQTVFLLITKNYFVYLTIQLIATVVNNIVISRKANVLYPYIKQTDYIIEKDEKKSIFFNLKSIAIVKFASVIFNGTDNTLISIMVGTVWVGYYSNYNFIINTLNGFINILFYSTTASIGDAVVKEMPDRRYEIFKSMQSISLIITAFITVCLFALMSDLIYVWIGAEYVLDFNVLLSIVVNFYIIGIVRPILLFREAAGLYRQTKYMILLASIENLFLSIVLGRLIGVAGIIYASAISRLTTFFWYEPKLLFNQFFNAKVKNYYIPLVKNSILTAILVTVFTIFEKNIFIDSWIKLIIKSALTSVITLATVILAYRKTEGYIMLTSRIKRLIRK